MLAKLVVHGPWRIAYAVKHALCSDGERRYARIINQADTFFTIQASVQVKGKTVYGYITRCETDRKQDYEFHAVQTGKNYDLLPN